MRRAVKDEFACLVSSVFCFQSLKLNNPKACSHQISSGEAKAQECHVVVRGLRRCRSEEESRESLGVNLVDVEGIGWLAG